MHIIDSCDYKYITRRLLSVTKISQIEVDRTLYC